MLTDGEVSATPELLVWAEAVVDGEPFPETGPAFDRPLLLQSRSYSVAWNVEVSRPSDAEPPEPEPGEIDDGIGQKAALERARAVLAELVQRRLAPDTDLRLLHTASVVTGTCSMSEQECARYVGEYWFVFGPYLGGVPVIGSGFKINVDREGAVVRVGGSTVDIGAAGSTVAAIDETAAELRFLELATEQSLSSEARIDTPGLVAYLVPLPGEASEAEPVWYGSWIGVSDEVAGRPQPSWLSLSDPNAPLVAYEP